MTRPPKHTPGPWQVARFNPDTAYCEVETVERGADVPEKGYQIAIVATWATEPGPDARLIAAAPDLLEACKMAASMIGGVPELEAAIAKAEGGAE